MICKTTLDKLGKAAFNSLTPEDQAKYTTASKVVSIITEIAKGGNIASLLPNVGIKLAQVGIQAGSAALISLANTIGGNENKTLADALKTLASYVSTQLAKLIDQTLHELANKLAVLFGIDENPGIIGAIMEWLYRSVLKPAIQAA